MTSALDQLSANAGLVREVQAQVASRTGLPAPFTSARIRRERNEATRRLERNRDTVAWKTAMERLDRDEDQSVSASAPAISAGEVAAYLRDLPGLFAAAEPETQRRILQSLLDQVEVLGPLHLWLHPSAEAVARGMAAAFQGEFRMKECQTGRGERLRPDRNDMLGTVRVAPRTAVEAAPHVA